MKILIALAILICLVGCQTASKKPVADTYTVQVMEVMVPADVTPAAWPIFIWAKDLSHLQGDLSQYIRRKAWAGNDMFSMLPLEEDPIEGIEYADVRVMSAAADRMLRMPGTKITEFPLVQLSAGERVINDQTETFELPTDYAVVDGKAVVTMKETFRSGLSIYLELLKTDASVATYRLKLFSGHQRGFDSFILPNGDEISMPYFEVRSHNSEIIQPLNSWNMIVGLGTERTDEGKILGESQIIYIRILPPSSTVESPANGTASNGWNFIE